MASNGDRGKAFERELAASMRAAGLLVHRIRDCVMYANGRSYGEKNPCDFYALAPVGDSVVALAVEAKAVSGESIPFDRLQRHQLEALLEFDSISRSMGGYVAVNFYELGNLRGLNRMFMVPVAFWAAKMASSDRKSLAMSECEAAVECVECPRCAGSEYDMRGWSRVVTGGSE